MIELIEDEPEVASEVVDRAEISGDKVLVEYSKTEAGLAALKADLSGKTYDMTTTADDKDARADRLRCVTLRTTLEKTRKAFKAPAIEFGEKIDAEAQRITAAIEAVENPIDSAIKADEQRRAAINAERERIETERVKQYHAGIAKIRAYISQAHGKTAEQLNKAIAMLGGYRCDEDSWEEFAGEARAARDETVAELTGLLNAADERATAARQEQDRRAAASMAAPQVNDCTGTGSVAERPEPQIPAVKGPSPVQPDETMKLGEICSRLGFIVNAAFLAGIGFDARTDKNLRLYSVSAWPAIKSAIVAHINALA